MYIYFVNIANVLIAGNIVFVEVSFWLKEKEFFLVGISNYLERYSNLNKKTKTGRGADVVVRVR